MKYKVKDYIIKVKSNFESNNGNDSTELITTGIYYYNKNIITISYSESDLAGYDECFVTVKIYENKKITIERSGKLKSYMVIEDNKRNVSRYETHYCNFLLGLTGKFFNIRLDENGGNIFFSYKVDINGVFSNLNKVHIEVIKKISSKTNIF